MADLVITTTRQPATGARARAEYWSRLLGAPVTTRRARSIAAVCEEEGVRGALVVAAERETYYEPAAAIEYFFHPNMAAVRVKNTENGQPDHMIEAMRLGPGDEVLDCTMGRASDAIICAHAVGETGRVVAIEKAPVIAHLTIEGLRTSEFVGPRFTELMRRVDARCADHREFLPECDTGSFDVVYFDPIFHQPIEKSQSMEDLRALAHKESLTRDAVEEARRVCRRCVVIKQRRGTRLWEELGVSQVHGGSGSRVEYGVIEVDGKGGIRHQGSGIR